MFGNEEAAHIAQHHQNVLVHGIDVEQVMLHLPHDAAKHPQVTPQHRGLVHQPHRMRCALRLHQNLAEGLAIDRVAAKARVHQVAGVVQRSQRAGRQTLDSNHRLVDQKGLQNGVGLSLVQIIADHVDHAGLVIKVFVDAPGRVG